MSKIQDQDGGGVPIACDFSALTAAERDVLEHAAREVYSKVVEVEELDDGFRFRLPTEASTVRSLCEYVQYERLCCPFLDFRIEIEQNLGPMRLVLTGGDGVKEYFRSLLEGNGFRFKR